MSILPIHNEQSLLRDMQQGDESAFSLIYRHYSPPIYSKAFDLLKDREMAEEVVQEIFTRIWQKKEIIDPLRNFSGFLAVIASHYILDLFRKIKRDRVLEARFLQQTAPYYQHIEENLDYKESNLLFKEALEQLPPQQYKVYQLCKMEGYSYKDAAEKLGISAGTVKEYLVAANKIIRKYMSDHLETGSAMILISLIKQWWQ